MSNDYKLIADPDIIKVLIQENNDPLIDLKNQDIIQFGPSPEIENNTDYTKLRKTVYNKLVEAQDYLSGGLKFCLYEGYRSLSLQKQLFDQRYELVKNKHPEWTHEKIFTEATKLVSPLINLDGTKNIPPHSTGGAIDIYLIDHNGAAVEMGILTKDWMADTDGSISLTNSSHISETARYYRKKMSDALIQVGFINYPTEYWHWSYGDKYWAYCANHSHALYDTVTT